MGTYISRCWDREHYDRLDRIEQRIQHYEEVCELWITNAKQDCCAFVNSKNKKINI